MHYVNGGSQEYRCTSVCVCLHQPAVTQQNTVSASVRLQNIPEITNTMEGGERKLGLFSFTILEEAACKSGVGTDTHV